MGIYMNIYNGVVTAGAKDGNLVSSGENTNPILVTSVNSVLSAAAEIGATIITIANTKDFSVGQTIFLDSQANQEVRKINEVGETTLTLDTALEFNHAKDTPVIWTLDNATNQISTPQKLAIRCIDSKITSAATVIMPLCGTITAAAEAGVTTLQVSSTLGFIVGGKFKIGNEVVTLTAVTANSVTFTPALTAAVTKDAVITVANADKWAFALDNGGVPGTFGDWGKAITLPAGIGDTNKIFWVKACTTQDEAAGADNNVKLITSCASIITAS